MCRHGLVFRIATVVLASAIVACGGASSGNTCSDPPAIAGDWSGTISSDTAGGGTLSLAIDQTGCTLQGTWQAEYADPSEDGNGTISGTANASGITFNLVAPQASICGYNATASLSNPDDMRGQFSTVGLHCTASGSFNVLRQATPSPTMAPTATETPSPTPTP
jgi:hypothetical protein